MKLGQIEEMTCYPVKSMLGQGSSRMNITWSGVVGDRRWLVTKPDGTVITAKQKEGERLLTVTAHILVSETRIYFGGDQGLTCGTPEADAAVSDLLGQEVRLVQVDDRARTTNAGFALRPSTGADSSPLHLVTTSSLAAIGQGEETDDRRFRPNLVIRTPDGQTGFIEDAWAGHIIQIGDEVRLHIRKPTVRCALPARKQQSLPADGDLLRRLKDQNNNCLGVYASVIEVGRTGRLRRGDAVVML